MKRMLAVLAIAVIALACVFAEDDFVGTSTDATGILEAYKNLAPSALMKFEITLSNSKRNEIMGSAMSDRITASDLSNKKMANALTINVKSNRRNPIKVTLWFSPLISTAASGNKMVKMTWKVEKVTKGDTIFYDFVKDENGISVMRLFKDADGYAYKYSLDAAVTSNGATVTSVAASTNNGAEMVITFTPTAKKTLSAALLDLEALSWNDTVEIPETENGVLPGIWEGCEKVVESTVQLSATLGSDLTSLKPNVRYTATVRITIEGD